MLTPYINIWQLSKQDINIDTVLLTNLQTLFSFPQLFQKCPTDGPRSYVGHILQSVVTLVSSYLFHFFIFEEYWKYTLLKVPQFLLSEVFLILKIML